MASKSEFEFLNDEIKELLQNYKFKKATVYEPCTSTNFKECLIGLHEELELLNINYVFNPFCDAMEQTLQPEALVTLINATWTLMNYHKKNIEESENLKDRNHQLEYTNKQLKDTVAKLKEKVNVEKNESRACIASASKISNLSDETIQHLKDSKAQLALMRKQKENIEKALRTEINRLKQENEKLSDRLRKSGCTCSGDCSVTMLQLKERVNKYKDIIAKLELNIKELVQEVLVIKEKILLSASSV